MKDNYLQIIKQVNGKSKLSIKNESYKVLGKAEYVTQNNPTGIYVKIFLENHYVLVVSPDDLLMYFGKDVGDIGVNPKFEDTIKYNGLQYKLVNKDYQFVSKLEFGDPLSVEGEVKFWDYVKNDDENFLISIAIRMVDYRRSDVVAEVINPDDVKIL